MGALKLMASPTAIQAATRKTEHMASSLATSHTAVQATSHGTSGDASGQKPPVEGEGFELSLVEILHFQIILSTSIKHCGASSASLS